ncbi:hypothetical protein DFH11DRAFT_1646881 [Phellopilus nigrolimitatus]|nr:hypothetical protein DFH11DRAFT_1646881 [Phellopilus nigrolimitatus]
MVVILIKGTWRPCALTWISITVCIAKGHSERHSRRRTSAMRLKVEWWEAGTRRLLPLITKTLPSRIIRPQRRQPPIKLTSPS